MEIKEYFAKVYDLQAAMTTRHLATFKGFSDRILQNNDKSRKMDMIFDERQFADLLFAHTYNDTIGKILSSSRIPQKFEKAEVDNPGSVVHLAYTRAVDDVNKLFDECYPEEKLSNEKSEA